MAILNDLIVNGSSRFLNKIYAEDGVEGTASNAEKVNNHTVDKDVPSNAVFTDTTYESKTAANAGTDVSLVTTGEKYTWNNKQNALSTQTAYTSKGSATKVPQITTNTLGQVTGITEVTITQPDISGKQDKSTAVTHTASTAAGSATQPVYVNASGVATATTYALNKTVPSDAKFTDTTYSAGTGLLLNGTSFSINSSSVINKNDFLQTTNPFGGKQLYISKIDNGFYCANVRWTVTGTYTGNSSGTYSDSQLSNLFDGNYESTISIPAKSTAKIRITFDTSEKSIYNNVDVFPGYPYGYIYLSYYYQNVPSTPSKMRVYCNYSPHGIGEHEYTMSAFAGSYYVEGSTRTQNVIEQVRQPLYAISYIEFEISSPNDYAVSLTQIEFKLDRPDSSRTPFLSKYRPEKLFYNLTAPTFIGNLTGTATNASKVNNLTVETAVPSNAVFTDTTYESKTAANGGTAVSLVTTGEKYTWNNKQNALSTQTAYSAKGSATKVPQITTNTLGQVTGITEVTITQPDISGKQDKTTAVTHTASTAAGSSTKPVYVNTSGVATAIDSYEGNSASASKVLNTLRDSETGDTFIIPFINNTNTENKSLYSNSGLKYYTKEGAVKEEGSSTTPAAGSCRLSVGTQYAAGVDGNKEGSIGIYGSNTGLTSLKTNNNTTSNNTLYFPNESGTLATVSDGVLHAHNGTGTAAVTTSPYTFTKWDATITGVESLVDGMTISYKVPVAGNGSYGTCLQITSTKTDGTTYTSGYHPVVRGTTDHIGTRYAVGAIVMLTYCSSVSKAVYNNSASAASITGCWVCVNDIDNDDTTTASNLRLSYMRPYAKEAIYRYKLCGLDADNRLVPLVTTNQSNSTLVSTKQTTQVPIQASKGLFYYNTTSTTAAGAACATAILYNEANVATTYTFNSALTTYRAIYIKGEYDINTGLFTLKNSNSTDWYSQVPMNTASIKLSDYLATGYAYMLVGYTNNDTANISLVDNNTLYYFDGIDLLTYDMYLKSIEGANLLSNSEFGNVSTSPLLAYSTAETTSGGYADIDNNPVYYMSGPRYIQVALPTLVVGEKYTFSVDVIRPDTLNSQSVIISIFGESGYNAGYAISSKWITFSRTFIATANSKIAYIRINNALDDGANNYVAAVRHFKLVKNGCVPSWNGHNENINLKNANNSGIEIFAEGINILDYDDNLGDSGLSLSTTGITFPSGGVSRYDTNIGKNSITTPSLVAQTITANTFTGALKSNLVYNSRMTEPNFNVIGNYENALTYNIINGKTSTLTHNPPYGGGMLTTGWDTGVAWGGQFVIPQEKSGSMCYRGGDGSGTTTTWGDWKTVLDTGNHSTVTGVIDLSSSTKTITLTYPSSSKPTKCIITMSDNYYDGTARSSSHTAVISGLSSSASVTTATTIFYAGEGQQYTGEVKYTVSNGTITLTISPATSTTRIGKLTYVAQWLI